MVALSACDQIQYMYKKGAVPAAGHNCKCTKLHVSVSENAGVVLYKLCVCVCVCEMIHVCEMHEIACINLGIHTHAQTHACMSTATHAHSDTHTHTSMPTYTVTRAAHTSRHTHTYTGMHAHTHTLTPTHTTQHTQA